MTVIGICVLCAQSREIIKPSEPQQTKQLNETQTVVKNKSERDYYSDIDEDQYLRKVDDLRSLKNWIVLGITAFSFIGCVVILIILIHLKSRKASRLMYLT